MMMHNNPLQQREEAAGLDDRLFRLYDVELSGGSGGLEGQQQLADSHTLLVTAYGHGELMLDGERFRLRESVVYALRPGQTFGVRADKPDSLKLFVLRFDVFQADRSQDRRALSADERAVFPAHVEIMADAASQPALLCELIHSYWCNGDELERFRSRLAFQELLFAMLQSSGRPADDSHTGLEAARSFMERHYADNLTIEQLARIAEISPKYFVDLFKKTYGVSAMDFLTELRINRAKQFMMQSHAKLRDIAHQVGYNDEFYFSRKFKKEVGMSPTVYMKSRRRKIAVYRSSIIGQLLALKIIPYAAPLHPKWTAYYYSMYRSDIAVHLSAYRQNQHWEANIETLRQVHPDLLISMDELEEGEKARLSEVSPIFYVPTSGKDWRQQLQLTAEFLGERAEADSWLARYERSVATARERLQREVGGETCLAVRLLKRQLYVHCNRSMSEVFYGDLQMKPAGRGGREDNNRRVTLEQLAELDVDRLLVMVCQEAETLAYWESLQHTMLWQELKAVRSNRVHLIPSDPWLEYSALAHERIVEQAVQLFSGDRPK